MESVRARIWATRRADHVELIVFPLPGEIRPGLGEELTAAARRWSRVVDESRRIDSRMASAVGAMERRTPDRRGAWLSDISIHVEAMLMLAS